MLNKNETKNSYINLLLKKGKKEKIEKQYELTLFKIKKLKKLKINPQKAISNAVSKILRPVYLQKLSKYKYIIKYQPIKKQIYTALKSLVHCKNFPKKIKQLNNGLKPPKVNKLFYREIKRFKPFNFFV
jgi:hypothetical protein